MHMASTKEIRMPGHHAPSPSHSLPHCVVSISMRTLYVCLNGGFSGASLLLRRYDKMDAGK